MLTPMEQRLQAIEQAMVQVTRLQNAQQQAIGQAQGALTAQLTEAYGRVRQLRVAALAALQQGDVHGLVRILGINHAYDACIILGVGSLQALVSCTRNQFKMIGRPDNLGWGAADAIPPTIDDSVVNAVGGFLRSIGRRWREPHEKPFVKLPEPVLSRAFDASFNPKMRFKPEDFLSYAHPTLVHGIRDQCGSIINELGARGIYCWEDLTRRSAADLRRTGLHGSHDPTKAEGQFALVQREMRRRAVRFLKETPPVDVAMEAMDVDRINRDEIDEKEVMSFEDRIKVRDKVGSVVGTIDVKNEFADRLGAEEQEGDVHAGYADQGNNPLGVAEEVIDNPIEEDVKDDDDPPEQVQEGQATVVPPTNTSTNHN